MLDFDKIKPQVNDLARYAGNKSRAFRAGFDAVTIVADFSGRGQPVNPTEEVDIRVALLGNTAEGNVLALEFTFTPRAPQTSILAASAESDQLGVRAWDAILLPTNPNDAALLVSTLNSMTSNDPDCDFLHLINGKIETVDALDVVGELSGDR